MADDNFQPGGLPPQLRAMCEGLVNSDEIRYFFMDEALFVRDILPMLAGDDKELNMNFWLHKVGSYFKSIRVVKGKEVLFDVPPLFSNGAVSMPFAAPDDSLAEDMVRAELKANVHPGIGEKYLAEALHSRLKLEGPAAAKIFAAHINEILVRYGREPIYDVTGLGKPEDAPAASKAPAEDALYQDFDNGVELDD